MFGQRWVNVSDVETRFVGILLICDVHKMSRMMRHLYKHSFTLVDVWSHGDFAALCQRPHTIFLPLTIQKVDSFKTYPFSVFIQLYTSLSPNRGIS